MTTLEKIFPRWLMLGCVLFSVLKMDAGPLRRADVRADVTWLLHIDCDALRQTYLGRYLIYQLDKPELNSNMLTLASVLGFDLRTQIHGITIYSTGPTPLDAITILYADMDTSRLTRNLIDAEGATAITTNHHIIYSWMDKDATREDPKHPRKFANVEGRRLVIGRTQRNLVAALAAMDNVKPNLSGSSLWPEMGAGGKSFFTQSAARKMDFLSDDRNLAVLKVARTLKLEGHESNEHLNAVLTADFGDDQTAQQAAIVGGGYAALLSLQREKPELAKLANGLSIKPDGPIVRVTLSIPAPDFVAALKTLTDKKKKKK